MPLLGLQQVFDPQCNPRWHESEQQHLKRWQKFWHETGYGLDVVKYRQVSTGSIGRKIQATHSSFDNDAATIETTLRRFTGARPTFEEQWIDY